MSKSRESNENLLYSEVRNLSGRLNEFQTEFNRTVLALQEAAQAQALDTEQLSGLIKQLQSRLKYIETILKALQ